MLKNERIAGMVLGGMAVFLSVPSGYASDGVVVAPADVKVTDPGMAPAQMANAAGAEKFMQEGNQAVAAAIAFVPRPPPAEPPNDIPPPRDDDGKDAPPVPIDEDGKPVTPDPDAGPPCPADENIGNPPAPPAEEIDPECENLDEDPGYDPEDGLPVLFEPDLILPVPDPAFTDPEDLPVIEIADTATIDEEYPELDPKNGLI